MYSCLKCLKIRQRTYFEITFVDFTNVFTHSSDTLYLNIVKCHTSFCIPISKFTILICKKKTLIFRPFLANFDTKVKRILKKKMVYCEDSTRSWEHLNFPTHFIWHKLLLRKIKQPLKKFRLTTLASQSVEEFWLGRTTKNQIFTTSYRNFTIIQLHF